MHKNYWVDRNSESDNIIVANENTLFVGSSDKESCDLVEERLKSNVNPIEVLGSNDLLTIPMAQIQGLTSRSTDTDIDLVYRAKKKDEETSLDFQDLEEKAGFMKFLSLNCPGHLTQSESEQSAFAAAISPAFSLLVGSFATWLFYSKVPWVAMILGGLWVLGSLVMLKRRVGNPPVITRWSLTNRPVRKMWNGIKTVFSYSFLALVLLVIYAQIPNG